MLSRNQNKKALPPPKSSMEFVKTNVGTRAFPVAAPTLWNSLPVTANSEDGGYVQGEEKVSLLHPNEGRNKVTCCGGIREEFHLKNIFFEYEGEETAFYASQWHWPAIVFILYRLVAAAYITAWLLITALGLAAGKVRYPWAVWLTNWSYLALTLHLLLAAILAVSASWQDGGFHCTRPLQTFRNASSTFEVNTPHRLPWYVKLDWLLFNIVCLSAFTVTLVYFIGLYPQMGAYRPPLIEDINLHAMNLVVVVLELACGAVPVRLLHGVYPILYGLVYTIFSLIYWSGDHSRVLYPKILDWNHPGSTAAIIAGLLLVGVPLLQTAIFGVYKLKLCVYRRIYMSRLG